MISEEWRIFLYPLGLISALVFGARFIIQWLQSESAGKSIVPRSFWNLSLVGNISLFLHSFIQVQFHVCLIQACNAVIAWRNLDLMQLKKPPYAFKTVLIILSSVCLLTITAFALQSQLSLNQDAWFRIPSASGHNATAPSFSLIWHLFGFLGYTLFSCRFWIQWWLAEKQHRSYLPLSFWWLSLIGALFSCFYFLSILDWVNFVGPAVGLVPYIRNLMLIYKKDKFPKQA